MRPLPGKGNEADEVMRGSHPPMVGKPYNPWSSHQPVVGLDASTPQHLPYDPAERQNPGWIPDDEYWSRRQEVRALDTNGRADGLSQEALTAVLAAAPDWETWPETPPRSAALPPGECSLGGLWSEVDREQGRIVALFLRILATVGQLYKQRITPVFKEQFHAVLVYRHRVREWGTGRDVPAGCAAAGFLADNQARLLHAVFGLDFLFEWSAIAHNKCHALVSCYQRMGISCRPVVQIFVSETDQHAMGATGTRESLVDGFYEVAAREESEPDSETDIYGLTPSPEARAAIAVMRQRYGLSPSNWPGNRLPPILSQDFATFFPVKHDREEATVIALFEDASLHLAWWDINTYLFLGASDRWYWMAGRVEPMDGEDETRYERCGIRALAEEVGWNKDVSPRLFGATTHMVRNRVGTVRERMFAAVVDKEMELILTFAPDGRHRAYTKLSMRALRVAAGRGIWQTAEVGSKPFQDPFIYERTERALTMLHNEYRDEGILTNAQIGDIAERQRQDGMTDADHHEERMQFEVDQVAGDWQEWRDAVDHEAHAHGEDLPD
jgi:hypothetical protein